MDKICVMVRIRPMDSQEEAKSSPWRVSGNSISLHNQQTKFEFDKIFSEDSKNSDIYAARAKDIVSAAVGGFNGTVFAYGQTSSGKTHTMRGKVTEPGVIPLAVQDLFHVIQEVEDREFLLRMSYMEIYNEEINDLLVPEHRRLQIHESLERGIFVAGLREEIVVSPEQVLEFMDFGESHRHIGQTNMNMYSSRSHTIFRMIIESRERNDDGEVGSYCDAVRVSVLNLVDLAGSERVAKTGAEGVRLKEGSHINKSLMTLGTVINKLSEGAESIGGHVPYRDSKLTRILQPALGGNSNTAIICNITLAQIHTDETKSSLQFASRALRVTNCAHVNEILTDAALLKRQKKEIEELRAKLMDSHSEHLEDEVLSLRNTLLQSELERERISLELQAEKKAQAQRDQRLQEQAQKIANLSSMVLYTAKDVREKDTKKSRRRETWCPGAPFGKPLEEETAVKGIFNTEKDKDLFILQEECEQESEENDGTNLSCILENNERRESLDICRLPDEHAMLHVTHRRKGPIHADSPGGSSDLLEIRRKYEDLLIDFETLKAEKDLEITSLKNQLSSLGGNRCRSGTNLTERELEAILVIKQLQDQISMLEKENSTMQTHIDSLVDSARVQNLNASKTCDELCQELVDAREETRIAHEQLSSVTTTEETTELLKTLMFKVGNQEHLLKELEDVTSELQHLEGSFDSTFLSLRDVFCSFKGLLSILPKYRSMMHENVVSLQLKHEKACQSLAAEIEEKEKEKELCHEYEGKIATLINQVNSLQKEVSSLSTSSSVKQKETLRKDLEKTKEKLRETESKLKNYIQDKVKLESERANNEREIKRLLGQLNLLERDISKRESLAGRRDKASIEQTLQVKNTELERANFDLNILMERNKKLETTSFEMMEKVAALEEQLTIEHEKNEEIMAKNISLASELETETEKLALANSQLSFLMEETSSLKHQLSESGSICTKLESTICSLSSEKEELVMQFTDALMQQEEERAIWFSKERHITNRLLEKESSTSAEIALLSEEICKAKKECNHFKEHCDALGERLVLAEATSEQERKNSNRCLMEIDQLKELLKRTEVENIEYQDELKSRIDFLSSEKMRISKELDEMKTSFNLLSEEKTQIVARQKLAEDFNKQIASLSKERAKLRITLWNTQIMLDVFRIRHKEELNLMNRNFEEASKKWKNELRSSRLHNLDLLRQLNNRECPTCSSTYVN